MRSLLLIPTATFWVLLASDASAAEQWAGDWVMKRIAVDVTVQSWGPNCGIEPKSFSRTTNSSVQIKETNGHLIFSTADIRTDTCGSMNPKVRSVLAKKGGGRWKRVCKTAADDPKSEEGEYLLEADGSNHLEYTAASKFNWTLKGDHCIASSIERRTYVRVGSSNATPSLPPISNIKAPPAAEPAPSPDNEDIYQNPECATPGKTIRIEVSPRSAVIGPGERICLSVTFVDAVGCKTEPDKRIVWTAKQDDRAIPRLMTANGCFQAGDTAADSEGTYIVTAASGGKTAEASITVAFPDLGELFAARLRPLEDAEPEQPEEVAETTPPTPIKIDTVPSPARSLPVQAPTPQAEEDGSAPYLLISIIAAMVLLVASVIIFLKKRRTSMDEEAAEEEDFEQSLLIRGFKAASDLPEAPFSKPRSSTERVKGKICPKCGNKFDVFSSFCPYDKSDLVLISPGSTDAPTGMICPKCHRGYEGDAKYCPHDAEQLVPYADWRLSKLPPSP